MDEKKRRVVPSAVSIQVDDLLKALKEQEEKTQVKTTKTYKELEDQVLGKNEPIKKEKKNKAVKPIDDGIPKRRGAPSKPMTSQKWGERVKYRKFRTIYSKTNTGLDIFELVDPHGIVTHHSFSVDGVMQFFNGAFDWTNVTKAEKNDLLDF
jgi:hypothetical protein